MTRGRVATAFAVVAFGMIVSAAASQAAASQPRSVQIAYTTGTATSGPYVWIANASGADGRKLGLGEEPLISPNGAYVAASEPESKGPALRLYSTTDVATRGLFNVASVSAVPLAWSPDSHYVAVQLSSTHLKTSQDGLAVIDTTTMQATMVASGVVYGASFDPSATGGDRLVYGLARSLDPTATVNLYTVGANGSRPTQLTHDGHSLQPVWSATGIVFVRQTLRGKTGYPLHQLWLRVGSRLTQLTHIPVGKLAAGLVPLDVSRSGDRILAEFVGEDTSYAWVVQVSPRRVQQVTAGSNKFIQGGAISSDGTRLLVDAGAFQAPASHGTVESVGFGGGKPTRLARGAEPTWTG